MSQNPSKFVTAIALFAIAISTSGQLAVAQDHFIGDGQGVNRVIKLRSQAIQQTPAAKQDVQSTSRGDRITRSTRPVANPNEIQFDSIQVPKSLQHQVQPVVQSPASTEKSVLDASPRNQFSPASHAREIESTTSVQVDEEDADLEKPTQAVTVRKSLISTEIRSPKTVNVNQSAELQINLRNLSEESIENVTLIAQIPAHAKFVSAIPAPTKVDGQNYEFVIPRIDGERMQQVHLNIMPTQKSPLEIGTQVLLKDLQRTVVGVQQPVLEMKISGPDQTATGKTLLHTLTIKNVGDGIATDLRLEALFPAGLSRTESSQATLISSIRPGAMLEIPFESRALTPGQGELKIVASSRNTEKQEASRNVSVHQPELRLSAVGPKLNFVQRDGIYTIDVENTGEVEVSDVRVSLAVPAGMKVTTISREAQVDAQRGTLSWNFETLAAKSKEQIQLKATAIQEGHQVCNIVISSNETLQKEFRLSTEVTTRADLSVQIKNQTGPVQVGAKAEFLVEVENQGSRQASDVSIAIVLPESLMPVEDDQYSITLENGLVFSQPLVEPGQKVTFKFQAVGVSKGDHVVRCTLQAAGSERKVISENSIYVYEVSEARVSESLSPVVPR